MAVPGSFANPTSIAEGTKVLMFPSTVEIKSQIPLWMKFYCFEYNNSAAGRAAMWSRTRGGGLGNVPGASLLKAQIAVPAPPNFTSTTQHSYKAENNDTQGIVDFALELVKNTKAGEKVSEFIEKVSQDPRVEKLKSAATGVMNLSGYGQSISMDHSELVYQPNGSIRQYEIQLYMPCLTVDDSSKAGQIITTFEAFSLPTLIGALSSSTAMMFHPPLWAFGIGPVTSLQMDPSWSGLPQVSVLKTVKSKKMALDTNSLAAISDSSQYKPIAYLLSLVFQELEPAVRLTSPVGEASSVIASRSAALLAGGNATAARVTQG